MSGSPRHLSALAILLGCVSTAAATDVNVFFCFEDRLEAVQREIPETATAVEAALDALAAGPTEQEQARGLTSALPAGTKINRLSIDGDKVVVDFSPELLVAGMDDLRLEAIFNQVRWTLEPLNLARNITLTVADASLADYLAKPAIASMAAKEPSEIQTQSVTASVGSALAAKVISLSPGHGQRWTGSEWRYERPQYCAPLNEEDLHNVELVAFLEAYLAQDGAITKPYRCLDKAYGSYAPGRSWWTMSAAYWLQHLGYPCSVYGSYTGDCVLGTGANDTSDSLYSRPRASDYDDADIYLSIHTDGSSGYCVGPTCPTGTLTIYDSSGIHSDWGTVSQQLATNVHNAVVDTIRTYYDEEPEWKSRGLMQANGAYAETREPQRAAILIEVGFHDTCDRDALYLRDFWFHSTAMWGMYKGVCDYFGVTPTYDFYSAEYVSDTIPSEMLPGHSYEVSVTLRNRGVMWNSDRQFKLGAVGDSDPLATSTRANIFGNILPGNTYTFTFTMQAPLAHGSYTTEWQMLREGVDWFGPIHSETVEVSREYARADWDEDRDVDLEDFGKFQACLTGPGQAQNDPACQKAKLDFDDDVDADDAAIFLACLSGTGVQADPYCGF